MRRCSTTPQRNTPCPHAVNYPIPVLSSPILVKSILSSHYRITLTISCVHCHVPSRSESRVVSYSPKRNPCHRNLVAHNPSRGLVSPVCMEDIQQVVVSGMVPRSSALVDITHIPVGIQRHSLLSTADDSLGAVLPYPTDDPVQDLDQSSSLATDHRNVRESAFAVLIACKTRTPSSSSHRTISPSNLERSTTSSAHNNSTQLTPTPLAPTAPAPPLPILNTLLPSAGRRPRPE